jgi:hypothetical protein
MKHIQLASVLLCVSALLFAGCKTACCEMDAESKAACGMACCADGKTDCANCPQCSAKK